ncbi:hypothetical protein BCR34DRAFT_557220 [Clohesyomyces aquaticus]|uniref:Transmembrane protein n=1 Tax=Clohesyomyces aquaticus TaxID=1231657 RepID=A0A1Y2A358_9PLEO|nr:hypothetical protein BCR34DRAFT_557220 [Clohesyomyces aquaticus]
MTSIISRLRMMPPRLPGYSLPPSDVQPPSEEVFLQETAYSNSSQQPHPQVSAQGHGSRRPAPPAASSTLVVAPFGNLNTSSPALNDTNTNTCSLNLVCYNNGCRVSQIRVHRWKHHDPQVRRITTDEEFFRELRVRWRRDMAGWWRCTFSLKTLKRLRLLSYADNTRPVPVPMDEFTMAEVLHAFQHPELFSSAPTTDWINWVFRLRRPSGRRHAIEFVEGWDAQRIAIVSSIPCVLSTLVGVVWTVSKGDAQTAFTVAGFVLGLSTVMLALLAVVSGIDSGSGVR